KALSSPNLARRRKVDGGCCGCESRACAAPEPIEDGLPPLALTQARVEFANVSFAYRPGEPVLRGMSFVAEPSRMTALVGHSGGGKSAVLNLLLRLYDAQSGNVMIAGQGVAPVSAA